LELEELEEPLDFDSNSLDDAGACAVLAVGSEVAEAEVEEAVVVEARLGVEEEEDEETDVEAEAGEEEAEESEGPPGVTVEGVGTV